MRSVTTINTILSLLWFACEATTPREGFRNWGEVFRSIICYVKTLRKFASCRTNGFPCQLHFLLVDAIHAIVSRSVSKEGGGPGRPWLSI